MAGYLTLTDAQSDLFGAGRDGFREGTPPTIQPTVVPADWYNMTTRELAYAVETLGGVPNSSDWTQLGTQVLAHLDDVRMRSRWGTWDRIHDTGLSSESKCGDIWARYGGRQMILTGTDTLLFIVDYAGTSSTTKDYIFRVYPTESGKCSIHGKDPGGVAATYAGPPATTTASSNSWELFTSIPGPSSSGLIRKAKTTWRVEDGYSSTSSSTNIGVAPSLSGNFCGLFYAGGRVTMLAQSTVAVSDDSCATWTVSGHGATPVEVNEGYFNREIAQASLQAGSSSILIIGAETSYTVSTDNGGTWATYSTPEGATIYDIKAGGGEIALLGIQGGTTRVWVTRDGVTWQERYVPVDTYRIYIEEFGPSAMRLSRIYAMTATGVYMSAAA